MERSERLTNGKGTQEETHEQGGNYAAYMQKVNHVVVARIETTTTTTTTTDRCYRGTSSALAVASPSDASSSFSLPPPVPHLRSSILPPLLTQLRKLARRKLTCRSPNPVSHTASSWQRSMAGREPRVLGAPPPLEATTQSSELRMGRDGGVVVVVLMMMMVVVMVVVVSVFRGARSWGC
ncbi:hypothetical protein C0Q70_03343 [Pomacea canaliculata]|uniref:Uncharacterized protein n=1 Tax=Pomacea canaliculata TaxID=400727 RepID=A0A2T7PSG0_POMCA|nr:hypothetical protein C0Q70_03343 [Pomacea canaliculata]